MKEPKIIYEEKNFLAINKPEGMLVYGSPGSGRKPPGITLVDWLSERYPQIREVGDDPKLRPGIVHRLDRDTSGIMLVAKNQKYFEYLKSLFQRRRIKKTYLALVYGEVEPKEGIIEKEIKIKTGSIKRTLWKGIKGKSAITRYRVKEYFNGYSLLEILPQTGRTHQIRIHLAGIGHPIVGDKLYGQKRDSKERLMLHAFSLEFSTVEGKRLKLETELPEFFPHIMTSAAVAT